MEHETPTSNSWLWKEDVGPVQRSLGLGLLSLSLKLDALAHSVLNILDRGRSLGISFNLSLLLLMRHAFEKYALFDMMYAIICAMCLLTLKMTSYFKIFLMLYLEYRGLSYKH